MQNELKVFLHASQKDPKQQDSKQQGTKQQDSKQQDPKQQGSKSLIFLLFSDFQRKSYVFMRITNVCLRVESRRQESVNNGPNTTLANDK
jgi:hypothetical protein